MIFNRHSDFAGKHAFMGASNYHWINYDTDKLISVFSSTLAKERGTKLHAFAAECINIGQPLPKVKKTLNMYVNDGIRFGMSTEQILYYSKYCFGTADTICFRKNMLRIHDYKSGEVPAHMEQLFIYMALFCLEYHYDPKKIDAELRLYQCDDIISVSPDPIDICNIMNKIIEFDKVISKITDTDNI